MYVLFLFHLDFDIFSVVVFLTALAYSKVKRAPPPKNPFVGASGSVTSTSTATSAASASSADTSDPFEISGKSESFLDSIPSVLAKYLMFLYKRCPTFVQLLLKSEQLQESLVSFCVLKICHCPSLSCSPLHE